MVLKLNFRVRMDLWKRVRRVNVISVVSVSVSLVMRGI